MIVELLLVSGFALGCWAIIQAGSLAVILAIVIVAVLVSAFS